MKSLARSYASVAWLVLVGLTLISWSLGTHDGLAFNHTVISLIIIFIAVVKIRIIGLNFMELRNAPRWLRGIFECYSAALLFVLSSFYLFA
jgi:hypothetical protein